MTVSGCSRISLSTRTPISCCFLLRSFGSSVNHSPALRTDISEAWPICRPAIFTAMASGFRRKPLQASQGSVVHIAGVGGKIDAHVRSAHPTA